MRSSLAHIRQSRIAPSAINAPPNNFVPHPTGVGTPAAAASNPNPNASGSGIRGGGGGPRATKADDSTRKGKGKGAAAATEATPHGGLQEERINRDAWKGIVQALEMLENLKSTQKRE